MATLTDKVWTHLITQGVVRDPRVAGALPPAFRQPADGTPAPGEGLGAEIGPTAVIGIYRDLGIAAAFLEGQWRRDMIDIIYRTQKWPTTEALYAQVRTQLVDKMNFVMAGMRVIQSVEWVALTRIDSSTAQGFTSRSSVLFETYAADHF